METAIMKSILDHFHQESTISTQQIQQIVNFLFKNDLDITLIEDQDLIETLEYLKEIVIDHALITVIDLQQYCNNRMAEYQGMIENVVNELNEADEKVSASMDLSDHFISAQGPLLLNSLLSPMTELEIRTQYTTFNQQLENLLTNYRELHAKSIQLEWSRLKEHKIKIKRIDNTDFSMTKVVMLYLEGFTDFSDRRELFFWSTNLDKETEFLNVINIELEPFSKSYFQFINPATQYCSTAFNKLQSIFGQLFSFLQKEEPIKDEELRNELVDWLIYSKSCDTNYLFNYLIDLNTEYSVCNFIKPKRHHCKEVPKRITPDALYRSSLAMKRWTILKSPPGHFWLTSDNPGFGINLSDLVTGSLDAFPDPSLQDIRIDTLIYYPLTSDYCLRIQPESAAEPDNPHDNEVIEFQETSLQELNMVNGYTFSTKKAAVIAKDKKMIEQLELI